MGDSKNSHIIREFIICNYEKCTTGDVMRKFACSEQSVYRACKSAGLKLINDKRKDGRSKECKGGPKLLDISTPQGMSLLNFIKQNASRLCVSEFIEKCKISRTSLFRICKEHKITIAHQRKKKEVYILENHIFKSTKELAKELGMTPSGIRGIKRKLKIPCIREATYGGSNRFKLSNFIRANAHLYTYEEFAEKLKLSVTTVFNICQQLKIKAIRPADRNKNYVFENYKNKSISQLAADLNMTRQGIRTIMVKYNILWGLKPKASIESERHPGAQTKLSKNKETISVRQVFNAMNLSNINILDTL